MMRHAPAHTPARGQRRATIGPGKAVAFAHVVRGWINFYGRFYRSELVSLLENINEHLARWAMRKFKRLRGRPRRARRLLAAIAAREPDLFAHWVCGARPLAG